MKRNRKILICLNDAEFAALESLQAIYSADGAFVSKAFLFRYGLKRLPYQAAPLSP